MKHDVTIIGSGPGGYVAAIRCSQLGMKTALVEKNNLLGGTCLNVGCIPTKTLLELTAHLHEAQKNFGKYGIELASVNADLRKMMARKNSVIQQNAAGVAGLLQKNNVSLLKGGAMFITPGSIQVTDEANHKETITSDRFIIATGSQPASLPFASFDRKRILSSTEILSLEAVPDSLVIIGAGVIGLEIGSIFARLGTKVEVLEIEKSVLPGFDESVCKEILRSLKKLGIRFQLGCRVESVTARGDRVDTLAVDAKGNQLRLESEYCLVAVGRKPYTSGLGLETLGMELKSNGSIKTDSNLQTSIKSIYAIGDVIGGMMLAHKASEEGIFVAERLSGQQPTIDYKTIPSVVYIDPEAASVGYTEQELLRLNQAYKVGICQNRALGRAHTADKLDGFAKVLIAAESEEILGIHLIAPHASEMIGEAVLACEKKLTARKLSRLSHAHPTFLEAIKEACLQAIEGRSIHVP